MVEVDIPEDRCCALSVSWLKRPHAVTRRADYTVSRVVSRTCICIGYKLSTAVPPTYFTDYRYVLWEAEDAGLELPFACRMGCCTACAVKVQSGSVWQPEALGISKGLKEKGYALMCVGYPLEDTVLQTVEEDELYEMQFGKPFAELAVDKNSIFVERDDFALELAEMDE